MREVPLGSIEGIGNGIPDHLPYRRGNVVTLVSSFIRFRQPKRRFVFISVFLTDVCVEKRRNEIERSSARLRIWVRIEEIPIK